MIYDIRVFDKHGKLKEVINGQKCFDKLYEQGAKSFIIDRKKIKVTFICRFCNGEFPRRSPSQFCCGQAKCVYQRSLIKNPLKGGRDIVCRMCNKKATVQHSRAVTCGKECSKELNRKKHLVRGLAFRKKEKSERNLNQPQGA